MANLLSNPSLWKDDAGNTPPTYWNGTAYVFNTGGSGAAPQYIRLINPSSAGDICEGTMNNLAACTGSTPGSRIVQLYDVSNPGSPFYQNGTDMQSIGSWNVSTGSLGAGETIEFEANSQFVTSYAYDFTLTPPPIVTPSAPDLSVKVPNESTGTTITPQIAESGVPIQGYTLQVVTQPTQGTVTVSGGAFVYTPTLGTTLVPDSFTYTATDSDGNVSNVGTVNLFIFTQYNCACDDNDEPGQGFPTKTLDQLQRRVLVRLGMAAMPLPPPGMAETVNTFLEDAQIELYRMYKCFRLKRWFTWQMQQGVRFYDWHADIENVSMLVPAPSTLTATATTGTGTLAAGTYQYAITASNDNGETTPSQIVSATLSATGQIVLAWANQANVKGFTVYRMANNGPYQEPQLSFMAYVNNALSFTDSGSLTPTSQVPPRANGTSVCAKTLDPRRIDGVYISRGDNVWQPLYEGIPPTMYTSKIQAIPQRYEIRQCIEIWPAPSDDTWQLRITGDFALQRFTQPRDTTTIDPHAVYLKALADAQAHYNKQNASLTGNELMLYIKKLIAGTDSNTRLWPGTGVVINAIPPRMGGGGSP